MWCTISDIFSVNTGVRHVSVLVPTLSTLVWTIYWAGCRTTRTAFEAVRVTDLEFADDAVVFAETTEVLLEVY